MMFDAKKTTRFLETWRNFLDALQSTDDFDHLHWIGRLSSALCCEILLHMEQHFHMFKILRGWRTLIPAFAYCLILVVTGSFFLFYDFIIQDRWCGTRKCSGSNEIMKHEICLWGLFHTIMIVYFSFMVVSNFSRTIFGSPGAVLKEIPSNHSIIVGYNNDKSTFEEKNNGELLWTSFEGRGGFLCFNPQTVDIVKEKKRTNEYFPSKENVKSFKQCMNTNSTGSKRKSDWYPSPIPSYCQKCDIVRPPRCHHCSTCNRCVLQMDHHCPWMNNCIGYANYRTFILSLFYLVVGSWYGIALGFVPYLQVLIDQEGGSFMPSMLLKNVSHISPLCKRVHKLWIFNMTALDFFILLYPFLVAVSIVLSFFLFSHVKQISKGRTTLENIQILKELKRELRFGMKGKNKNYNSLAPYNPFHQGFQKNLKQILGPKLYLALLPVSVEPPSPFLPSSNSIDSKYSSKDLPMRANEYT